MFEKRPVILNEAQLPIVEHGIKSAIAGDFSFFSSSSSSSSNSSYYSSSSSSYYSSSSSSSSKITQQLSDKYELVGTRVNAIDVVVMDSVSAIAVYIDDLSSDDAKAIAFTYDEFGIQSKGTIATLGTGSYGDIRICRLSNTLAAVVFNNNAVCLTLSNETDLTVGTVNNFTSQGTGSTGIAMLDSTHFLVAQRWQASLVNRVSVRCFEVIGTTISQAAYSGELQDGDGVEGTGRPTGLTAFNDEYALVTFRDGTSNARAIVVQYNGTTSLQKGPLYTVLSGNNTGSIIPAAQNTTEALVYWTTITSSYIAKVATRSGLTLSFGSANGITNGRSSSHLEYFGSNKYCILYHTDKKAMRFNELLGTVTESGLSDQYATTTTSIYVQDAVSYATGDYGILVTRDTSTSMIARVIHIDLIS